MCCKVRRKIIVSRHSPILQRRLGKWLFGYYTISSIGEVTDRMAGRVSRQAMMDFVLTSL